jgi:hypothetical protein
MGKTLVCVRSSANENPAKDFNEWMQHVYHQVKINYEKKLNNNSKIKSDEQQSKKAQ